MTLNRLSARWHPLLTAGKYPTKVTARQRNTSHLTSPHQRTSTAATISPLDHHAEPALHGQSPRHRTAQSTQPPTHQASNLMQHDVPIVTARYTTHQTTAMVVSAPSRDPWKRHSTRHLSHKPTTCRRKASGGPCRANRGIRTAIYTLQRYLLYGAIHCASRPPS